jgi:MFS family permease
MSLSTALGAGVRRATAGLPRPFWFLCAGVFVTRAGSFVLPFLALYLTQVLKLPPGRAGLVIALYGAGGAAANPVGGFLADRIGRRAVMVTALGLGGAGMIALGMAHRIEVIAPAIFLVALVTEAYRPAMQAAVADLVGPEHRVRAFSLVYWVINVGFAIGLSVGGLLASRSFTWLFVGDGATTIVFAAIIWAAVPETRPAPPPRAAGVPRAHPLADFVVPYRDRLFVLFLVLSFLFALVFMQGASTFAVDLSAHGISNAWFGRVLALNGLLIMVLQPFLAPVLARHNRSRTLAAGAVLVGLGFGVNALARSLPWYALGVLVWTLGEIMALPMANALVADLAPADVRARYQGAFGLSFSLAVCAAPALGMAALERFGSAALWLGCLATGLLVAAGHLALRRALTATRRSRMAAATDGR